MGSNNTIKIGELCDVKGGKRLPKGESLIDSVTPHPYIRIVDFYKDGIRTKNLKYLKEETHEKISRYIIEEGNIYISIVGTIGLVGIIDHTLNGANLTENAAKIIIKDKNILNPKYLMYFLRSPKGQHEIEKRTVGSTQLKLAITRIKDIDIPLPSIKEQDNIVEVLDALTRKIILNNQTTANLERLALTLYKRWFIDFEFPNEVGEPYRTNEGKMVESESGLIPDGWEIGTANNLFEFSPRTSLKKGENAPFVEMKNLESSAMINEWANKEYKGSGSKFLDGDTLLARITPCLENGKIGYVNFLDPNQVGWGSTEFINIRSKSHISPVFTYYFASQPHFKSYAIKNMNGSSGRQRVKAETLAEYQMTLPPSSLIKKYTYLVEPIMEQMKVFRDENKSLESMRDSLLPKLLAGELTSDDSKEGKNVLV